MANSSHPAKEGVPAIVYGELREQMQTRLSRMAEERSRQNTDSHRMRSVIVGHQEMIMSLQQEYSWATSGAQEEEAHPREPPIDWEEDLRRTLAEAGDVVRAQALVTRSLTLRPAPRFVLAPLLLFPQRLKLWRLGKGTR